MIIDKEIELQVNNVTPADFLAYIRWRCKQKGIAVEIPTAKEFANAKEDSLGSTTEGHDDWKYDFYFVKPYNYQTCSIRKDGSAVFNEICEFEFDTEKKGHGYYYLKDYWNDEN